jgi:glycosyltransferase involved in cell wall biosynthesis
LKNKRICLLTSGHPLYDERIFWKFAKSLQVHGFDVFIICSTQNINTVVDQVYLFGFDGLSLTKKKKIEEFSSLLIKLNPDLIICSEMLPVFAAHRFKKINPKAKIIIDITEWFPENVAFKFKCINRWIKYFQLLLPYIYILQKVDHIIIGEQSKKHRYDIIAPGKPKTIIGYYPIIRYFNFIKPDLAKEEIILGYSGVITNERGIINLLRIADKLSEKYLNKKFRLLIFGKFTYQKEEEEFHHLLNKYKSIEVEFADWTDYDKMSTNIERMDICFDLRKRNFIYSNSLPIKIFEYMACGKPFIYSDIKPIREEINIDDHGYLVNPENDSEVIEAIENYLNNPNLAHRHSENSRKLIEDKKNWETESKKLIDLVNALLS